MTYKVEYEFPDKEVAQKFVSWMCGGRRVLDGGVGQFRIERYLPEI